MKLKWLWIPAAIVVLIGIAGLLDIRKRQLEASAPRPSQAAVIRQQPEVSLSGAIRPRNVQSVGATVAGNIEAFMANVGDEVFEGQTLARVGTAGLESDREGAANAVQLAEQQVSAAEAAVNSARMEVSRADADAQRSRMAYDRAEKTYSRQKTLHSAGATPRIVYEKAQQDYESALAEYQAMQKAALASADTLKSANERLELSKKLLEDKSRQLELAQGAYQAGEIRSPVDGLVVGRKGEVGKPALEAGDELFTIATDIYSLEVALTPPADVLKRIYPGQAAVVSVLDVQAGGIPGVVRGIKGAEAIVEFNSTISAIRPGMRADVRLKME